jgi:thiamine-phosphate pyrophosphorylase
MLRYAITDSLLFGRDEQARRAAILQQTTTLAAKNIDFLQLREKDLDPATLAALTREILAILRTHSPRTKLLINSRADIALATRAHGVHLTSAPGELTPTQIRTLYAAANLPTPIVSIACHTLAEVARARNEAATHILFGPVFEKQIRGEPISTGIGLNLLQQACDLAASTPVLALGGITTENAPACLAAGAAGIAAIRLFLTI